jgi:uncharacterized protein YqjF (DUF2071 family)
MTSTDPLTRQSWRNAVALHWPISGEVLRPLLPPGLTPTLLDGHCRITLAAFEVTEVEVTARVPLPQLPPFAQVEIRTYAEDRDGRTGVWYLHLAASSAAAATAARVGFGLTYEIGAITIESDGGEEPLVTVQARLDRSDPVALSLAVRGSAVTAPSPAGSLESALLAPAFAWTGAGNELSSIAVQRDEFRVSRATVEMLDETWLWSLGIKRPGTAPIAHLTREARVAIFPPETRRAAS